MKGIDRHEEGGGTTFTGDGIRMFRLTTMLRCLRMERMGIRMVRHSVYAQVKREFGFKGGKQAVYDQLLAHIRAELVKNQATQDDVDALLDGSRPM